MTEKTPVLETRQLCLRFGGVLALDHIDWSLRLGARHALIGPNGAGKTSLVNLLSGLMRPTAGSIILNGAAVTGWSMDRLARAGLMRTFQISQLVSGFTVLECLLLARAQRRGQGRGQGWHMFRAATASHRDRDWARLKLEQMELDTLAHSSVDHLSHGQRRLVEIALVMACAPRVLILDEPSAGLSAHERIRLCAHLNRLEETTAILMVEHDMEVVEMVAQEVSLLDSGRLIATGAVGIMRHYSPVKEHTG